MSDILEFQQETQQYAQYNQFIEQQKEYYKNLIAQGGQTLGEGTPLFVDTFKNVKNVFSTGKKLTSQLSTLKEDTEKAFEKSLEKVSKTAGEATQKVSETLQKGAEEGSKVVKDVIEHTREQAQELAKTTFRKSRLLKDKLKGLTEENKDNLSKLQDRYTELKQKVSEKVSKGADINIDEEIQKFKAEGNSIKSQISDMTGMDEEQTGKLLNTKKLGKFIEDVKEKEIPKLEEETKEVLQKKSSYIRTQIDKRLEGRARSKFEEEFERDPEDVSSRLSIITERDKALEETKKVFDPVSKKYELAKDKAKTTAEDVKAKAKTTAEDMKTKAGETVEQGKQKASEMMEKVGKEVGEQKQQFEEAGKEMIQKGEQTVKAGVKAVGETSDELLSKGVEAGKSILSKGAEGVSQLSKIGSEVAENVAKTATEGAESIAGSALEALGPAGEAVGTALLLYQGIKDIFTGEHHPAPPTMAAPSFTPNI